MYNIKFNSEINSEEQKALRRLTSFLYEHYGINFSLRREKVTRSRINKRLIQLEISSLQKYVEYLEKHPEEVHALLDEITTNKTGFFREPEHWEFMRDRLIPNWKKSDEINIWSSACSSGEEPYTAAIVLQSARDSNLLTQFKSDYRILATDLSRKIIREGVRAVYSEKKIEPIKKWDKRLLEKYFTRTNSGKWKISDQIRRQVIFREHNLKTGRSPFQDVFDLVLLRNVLIYFDREMIQHVIDNMIKALKPGGYLFISHTENINDIEHNLIRIQPAIYQKS